MLERAFLVSTGAETCDGAAYPAAMGLWVMIKGNYASMMLFLMA